jgi:nucleotide-binding universal stress UspA family protein
MSSRPTIVVGFKDSGDGKHALVWALDLARRLDALVNVVHVATPEDYPINPDTADWEIEGWHRLGDVRDEAERLLAACPDARFIERRGDPATVLHEIAEGCDALMIIVGLPRNGAGGWVSNLVSRPVSRAVTRQMRRPVLLVPHQGVAGVDSARG